MRNAFKSMLLALALGLSAVAASAQVTAYTLSGRLLDQDGKPVVGATITARHLISNQTYTVVTNVDGSYRFENIPTQGPYLVEAAVLGTTQAEQTVQAVPEGKPAEIPLVVVDRPFSDGDYTGGVKGTVVNRNGRQPVENARLNLYQGASSIASATSAPDGTFLIPNLADGMYTLVITAPDFLDTQVQVTVNDGYVKNMFNLSLTGIQRVAELDDDSFAQFDMDDSGFNDNPTILFGSNDVFNNIAGYNFSSVRFRARGYASESQDVYLAGVRMNDAVTGYSPYSLWSGLNEAMRSKETVTGNEVSDYGFGGYNGLTNIFGNASSVRKGLRGSVLTNSALYRLRLMASYATGLMDNGWSFAANVSARLGGNDWIDGVYYRSFAYYLAADKVFDDTHRLGFAFFGTPGQRGAQMASTQEVYDLMGDNMYNANWGYQNGKVRNARVRKTHEPVAFLKYDFTPSDRFEGSATLLYRFGKNGYTALDWYNAQDPRADYYRNLPSYFYNPDPEYKRDNMDKAWVAYESWVNGDPSIVHLNWDRLYQVNQQSEGGRSKYIQEERHVDQRDLNFAAAVKYRPTDWLTVTGGLDAKVNRTEYYKIIADLLGGQYYVNLDNFADRDYAATPAKTQNDLDYYLANGSAQVLGVGDKYGYDYYAQIRNIDAWADGRFTFGNFSADLAGRLGYNGFWREGLVRKGLFAGLREDGSDYIVDGVNLTTRDAYGNVITSYGKSDKADFLTYAGKVNLNYVIGGAQRVYADLGYYNDAPTFNQAFLSPRTRNSMVQDLETVKTFSSDVNWQYSGSGINVRATAYYTKIMDQSKVMSAYDDIQNAFSNFALSGIDQRHYGVELGFKVPTYVVPDLSLQGVLAAGRAEYTSTPKMVQTVDNSALPVAYDGQTVIAVPFWKSSPVFAKQVLADGTVQYPTREDGSYTFETEKMQRHYVPSTPQLAASLGLSYNWNYWFIEADVEYFDEAYLDMNPLYRTEYASKGPDQKYTPEEVEYMTTQEKFKAAWLVNLSVGKSWYIQRKYQLGFSLNAKNLLNRTDVKTGGYEQTRMVDNTESKERYFRFDPKYFYMAGTNYMLNVYFRF
ncbi:MAG: TonB-dependent receptor [Bacteroidales bacterium]|nr:TonB-dependent receptor [Bacteroidales bacterium]